MLNYYETMREYDILIIGGGPAGLTAGLYAIRNGIKVGLLAHEIGGTTNSILKIENWPGFEGSGAELMMKMYSQLKKYPIEIINQNVESVSQDKKGFLIKLKKEEIFTKKIIIATGSERRKMGIKGEKELIGKGVSYCATCDGFFFKNKIVTVIGGSDCAATSALALSDLAKKVVLIYRGKDLRCEKITKQRLEKKENVEIIYEGVPSEIVGKEKVEAIKIEVNSKTQEIKTDGIFVEIGSVPSSYFAKDLGIKTNEKGEIIVNDDMKTNVPGVYAAGDVTNQKLKQVIVASAQGAIAAKSAYEDLIKSP